ncbi:MAG TPA: hypothetical protein VHW02_12225 [Rhizomicrobium sp.]|jgi:predicted xylose isomerase-like sugar epimerase|nr:hypothetical protein [Rhizomicrobium sp.]
MSLPTILISTWDNGVFRVTGNTVHHELAGQTVRSLADDGQGGVLAIAGAHSLRRRAANGEWTDIATSKSDLSSCMAVGGAIFAGTDDAQILRADAQSALQRLPGFEATQGRDTWSPSLRPAACTFAEHAARSGSSLPFMCRGQFRTDVNHSREALPSPPGEKF